MKKTTLSHLNLEDAKRVVSKEDWEKVVEQISRDYDEGNEVKSDAKFSVPCPCPGTSKDPWNALLAEEKKTEKERDNPVVSLAPETSDTEPENKDQEGEGEAEYSQQSGAFKARARDIMEKPSPTFLVLAPRCVQVDLSYLRSPKDRESTKEVLIETIKAFSPIPGQVHVESLSKGRYLMKVTNKFISPRSDSVDSSDSAQHDSSETGEELDYLRSILEEFEQGLKLTPRYQGLATKTIKLGAKGFTKENISAAWRLNKDQDPVDIAKFLLKQIGDFKLINGLYKFN